jgi:hypothetical protein
MMIQGVVVSTQKDKTRTNRGRRAMEKERSPTESAIIDVGMCVVDSNRGKSFPAFLERMKKLTMVREVVINMIWESLPIYLAF